MQAVSGDGSTCRSGCSAPALTARRLAAMLGLPYAFASHFAPDALFQALNIYRAKFQPSPERAASYAMAGVNVIVAETDAEARHHFSSLQMRFTDMLRGARGYLKPPIDDIEAHWTPAKGPRLRGCWRAPLSDHRGSSGPSCGPSWNEPASTSLWSRRPSTTMGRAGNPMRCWPKSESSCGAVIWLGPWK